ncbi:hypothetical protein HA402_015980 [Bradysia odoriphaga]|nr:hypothetical protein HA402_015980 [Bradysia odoriphaga]
MERIHRPLVHHKIATRMLRYKPNAILVGLTGAGKTSLANKLCGTNHDAGAGRGSVTQNNFRNNVSVGMNSFWLIDTPGTDSSNDTYKHAFLLRKALTSTAINTIFVVVKFENRFEKMIDILYSQPVHLFKKKIVVMISHLDLSRNDEKDFTEICDLFAEQCPDVVNIIFYSEQGQADKIADCMFSCISNMNADKLEISDEDFHLKFNTVQATFQIRRSFNEYKRTALKLAGEYTSYLQSDDLESHANDKDDVLHMMMVKFKNDLDDMYDSFVREHGENMTEMNYFTFSIKMQSENVKLCDEFSNAVIPLMSYNLFDNQDPRNLIKQCPHCNLIWFKTEGCDGETTCGNRQFQNPTGGSVLSRFYKFVMTRVNGKLKIAKQKINKETPAPTQPTRVRPSIYMGCNTAFVWRDLPKLDDELILSLYKVKTMDEAKEIIKAERFSRISKTYESSFDSSFYG